MADAVFVNVYIVKLVNAVTELTKTNIMLQTLIAYTESINIGLSEQVTTLQAQLDKYQKAETKKAAKAIAKQAVLPEQTFLEATVNTD
jgi:hypothetical protein